MQQEIIYFNDSKNGIVVKSITKEVLQLQHLQCSKLKTKFIGVISLNLIFLVNLFNDNLLFTITCFI